jgi:hypothetical protein
MKAAFLSAAAALAGAALLASGPAPAQSRTGAADTAGERITRLVVYGSDPCPRGADGEIIVCGRRGEGERFRIPRELRDDAAAPDPEGTSWAARTESLEYAGRTGIQSCSTVGASGFTGCWTEMMRAARGDRRLGEGEPGR